MSLFDPRISNKSLSKWNFIKESGSKAINDKNFKREKHFINDFLFTKPFFLGSKAKLTPLDQLHNEYKHEGKDW